jgi:hypothetical protein
MFDNSGYRAFAGALSDAGGAFGNALMERNRRQSLAELGKFAQDGDYAGLSKAAFAMGDERLGLSALAMDQEQKKIAAQNEADASAFRIAGIAGGNASGGVTVNPGHPMSLPGASLSSAIIGQESGGNPNIGTSVNGAHGIGQILPATFARFAKPGEDINKPEDNLAVSRRITDTYMQRYGDPARAAVAYFSGEGNVAPPGSPTPWKEDRKDGNGKSVSSYVSDVLGRMNRGSSVQVADASGRIPENVFQQPVQPTSADGLLARKANLEKALESSKLSAGVRAQLTELLNITEKNIENSGIRPTEAQRNYNLARQQGYGGSFMDYQAETKGGTTVNVGPNEGEFAKKAAAKQADRFAAISEEGDTARNDLALISQLREMRNVIGTGGGAALQAKLAEYGVKVGPNIGEIEAYQAIVDKLTPSQRIPGSGTTSDRDMAIFKSSLPSLVKTPDGNAIIERVLSSLAQSKIARADIADRVLSGETSAKDGVAELRKLPNPFEAMKGAGQPAPSQEQQKPDAPPNLIPEPPAGVTAEQITQQAMDRIQRNPAQRGAVIEQMRIWKQRIPQLVVPQ